MAHFLNELRLKKHEMLGVYASIAVILVHTCMPRYVQSRKLGATIIYRSYTLFYPIFNINPIEQWMEALEENKKLYERLLQAEKEKVALLEKILDSKK